MLDQIELQADVERELSGLASIKSALTERIKRQLVYLAYNRGMTGIKRLLNGYVDYKKSMNQVVLEQDLDLNQNLARVKKILKAEPAKRAILVRAVKKGKLNKLSFAEYAVIHNATYVADMVATQDYVQRQLGDQCSRF